MYSKGYLHRVAGLLLMFIVGKTTKIASSPVVSSKIYYFLLHHYRLRKKRGFDVNERFSKSFLCPHAGVPFHQSPQNIHQSEYVYASNGCDSRDKFQVDDELIVQAL